MMATPEVYVVLPPGPYRGHQAAAVDAITRALRGESVRVQGPNVWRIVNHLAGQIPGAVHVIRLPNGGEIEEEEEERWHAFS
jgi:hypothetical protein